MGQAVKTSDIESLKSELVQAVEAANDLDSLEQARVTALGKKGRVTELMKGLGGVPAEERREMGQMLNQLKNEIANVIESRTAELKRAELSARLENDRVDVTLPVRPQHTGHVHPTSQTMDELVAIFADMGFSLVEGPEIEDDFHNFTALNFPPEHPAREMHDTFYMPDAPDEEGDKARRLLRTHTSTVQIRYMTQNKPPFRIIVGGRVYRSDYDMTHTPMFHQLEGLMIDEKTHMGHLKGCLVDFLQTYFEVENLPVRFRPSFFPFTEPSAEMDIGYAREGGSLKIGGGDDWMEILGCGMVHPNVLRNCGIDPEKYQGFAFGLGIDRIAMLKYGIPDLRAFFDADLRWLKHYGFGPLDQPNLATGL